MNEQLRLRLNKELGFNIPKDAIFTKVNGDRKWVCTWPDYVQDISSIFTVDELLEAESLWLFNYTEIMIGTSIKYGPKFYMDTYRERIWNVFGW
jgi:hypothetical protein